MKKVRPLQERVRETLLAELDRLGRPLLRPCLCLSDAAWRRAMLEIGCPAYAARLASPSARRGTRGKLGMATVCHFRHGHDAVVYIKTRGRTWPEIEDTVRHEALHLARPSYSHRKVDAALRLRQVSSGKRNARPAPSRAAGETTLGS